MSEWLTSSVPPKLAVRHILQIDEECEKAPASEDIQVCRGPFGAFRLSQHQSSSPCNLLSDCSEDTSSSVDLVQVNNDNLFPSDAALSPWSQILLELGLEQFDQDLIVPSSDSWNTAMDSCRVQEVFDTISMPEIQESPITPVSSRGYLFPQFTLDMQFNHSMSPNPLSIISNTTDSVPQDAVALVKYYATTILSLLTPFRHTKTPWHVLFIPHAKQCLAALTLGDNLDHASLGAFYGTLAISAFSLGGVFQSQMWLDKGRAYKHQARENVRLMLKTAYDVPKVAKYKSILMALITMVQVSIFSGNRDQTECYFLEAEKFIRLRGLNRKKSRKVRLLHHCYAFERIFYESTALGGINSSHRHHVRNAVESSGLVVYGQDSLSFHLPKWGNLDQEMLEVKSQEEGENDLHLERPGIWSDTLYPEIFGIPESWILMVSLVIRLGKEKDDAEQRNVMNVHILNDFLSRAKSIERCIGRMQRPSQTTDASANYQSQTDRDVLENMRDAMQHAVAIYFYRRIYDVNASMLQQKVVSVRDCLLRCDFADPTGLSGSARLIWPAFIAACEAEDPGVQVSFSNWFKNSAERSGLRCFTDTLEKIERIWQEKRNFNGENVTWLDLMKKMVVSGQSSVIVDPL